MSRHIFKILSAWTSKNVCKAVKTIIINLVFLFLPFVCNLNTPNSDKDHVTVPGGPNRRHPFGGLIPTLWNSSGFVKGSSITCKKIINFLYYFIIINYMYPNYICCSFKYTLGQTDFKLVIFSLFVGFLKKINMHTTHHPTQ